MNRVLTSFVIVTMVQIGRNLFSEIFPVWICDWPAATKRQYCVTYIRIRMIAGMIFERFEIDRSRLDIFSYISPSCEKKKIENPRTPYSKNTKNSVPQLFLYRKSLYITVNCTFESFNLSPVSTAIRNKFIISTIYIYIYIMHGSIVSSDLLFPRSSALRFTFYSSYYFHKLLL